MEESKKKAKRQHLFEVFVKGPDIFTLLVGCFALLTAILVYRKLTKQKGSWGKNLSLDKIYAFEPNAPKTNFDSRGEIECRKYLETVFQLPFPKARPHFLRNPVTQQNLELDCFNPDLRLGVEYNGQQHYAYTSFFHKNTEASTNQQYRDELKRRMCRENNINLVEVPYTIKLHDIGPFLQLKLTQLGYF